MKKTPLNFGLDFFSFTITPFSFFFCHFSFVIVLLSFLLTTCSTSTNSDKQVVFSGSVTLEDETDYSGVMVSLYNLVELDTALVRINEQYPNIGVQISQETEFDHRNEIAIKTTTTSADGSWKIKVDEGVYNVVVEKDGFGWKYTHEKDGDQTMASGLSEEIVVSGIKGNNFTFESGKFYKISGEVTFVASLEIQKAIVVAEENASIRILGPVSTNISSGFAMFTTENQDENWNGIALESEANTLRSLLIKNARDGIKVKSKKNTFSNLYISDSELTGIAVFSEMDQNSLTNLLISKQQTGIEFSFVDSTVILLKSIIINSIMQGLYINNSLSKINNTVFSNNEIGIYSVFDSDAEIKHCLFEKNKQYDIQLGGSDLLITYNDFTSLAQIGIYISYIRYAGASQPIINFNNFTNANFYIKIDAHSSNLSKFDIDAKNNWWGDLTTAEIDEKILDKNDYGPSNRRYYVLGIIDYTPFQTSKIITAGINQ